MQTHDTRGEIYRDWLIVPIASSDRYFCEIHSPEGHWNMNFQPFLSPDEAVACGRAEIDRIIEIFEQAPSTQT